MTKQEEINDLRGRYANLTNVEHERLIKLDMFGALCLLVESAGLTMTLYGKPVREEALRTFCTVKACDRLTGVEPNDERDAEVAHALIDLDTSSGTPCNT